MFGAGWTEMLIIGVVALVVIGPKDLPIVMRKLGRMVGTVRRMGDEFQRELNKTTGLDQITDLRRSITEPLRQTSQEIAAEFNKVTATGVEPSGIIKPTDPAVESVYDQIAATSGLAQSTPPAADNAGAAITPPPPVMKPLAAADGPTPAPGEALPPASPAKPKRSSKPRAEATAGQPAKPAGKAVAAGQPAKRARKAVAAEPAASKPVTARKSAAKKTVAGEAVPVGEAAVAAPVPAASAPKPKRTRSVAKPAPAVAAAVAADAMGNDTADANAEKA